MIALRVHSSGHTLAGQPDVRGQVYAEKLLITIPEIEFAHQVCIVRRQVCQRNTTGDDLWQLFDFDDLSLQVVERRQDCQVPEIAVVAVHAEVVPPENDVSTGANNHGTACDQQNDDDLRPKFL